MSSRLTIKPASLSAFQQKLQQSMSNVSRASSRGMDYALERALNRSQSRVPRVTGALANSVATSKQGNQYYFKRTIGYGSSVINPRSGRPTSEYAVRVHEVYHQQHPNSYKWLERSMREYGQDGYLTDLASYIRSNL